MKAFRSLFARTAAAIGVAILVYDLLTHAFLGHYLFMPMVRRSADDLAAMMVLTAESWNDRWAPERPEFADRIANDHGLRLDPPITGLVPLGNSSSPYVAALVEAMEQRTGTSAEVLTDRHGAWYWVDVPVEGESVRIGFSADRLGADPLVTLYLMLALGSVLAFGTALVFVRRINQPLRRLVDVAGRIGQGEFPDALPTTGPDEIAQLTTAFNHMNTQVRQLLAGRTTLLVGVSHDLRTPLARMQFAVEMLSPDTDPKLAAALRRDIEEMDRLIGRFLEIGKGFSGESVEELEISTVIEELIDGVTRLGGRCEWVGRHACTVFAQPLALRRILANLLDNAVRYGGGQLVTVTQRCERDRCIVCIADRGPGIPDDEQEAVFRPFHRLEQSRAVETGGSGLGLAIARQLADANGWEVSLRAREGGGSEAVLIIPAGSRRQAGKGSAPRTATVAVRAQEV
ncbi:MAG TPA: ATP-binding protein [Azoarcus taiwanensis]|nr:ATP-binding protein [Azoarcus taiwanensis]